MKKLFGLRVLALWVCALSAAPAQNYPSVHYSAVQLGTGSGADLATTLAAAQTAASNAATAAATAQSTANAAAAAAAAAQTAASAAATPGSVATAQSAATAAAAAAAAAQTSANNAATAAAAAQSTANSAATAAAAAQTTANAAATTSSVTTVQTAASNAATAAAAAQSAANSAATAAASAVTTANSAASTAAAAQATANTAITSIGAEVTRATGAEATKEATANKDVTNGYAGLVGGQLSGNELGAIATVLVPSPITPTAGGLTPMQFSLNYMITDFINLDPTMPPYNMVGDSDGSAGTDNLVGYNKLVARYNALCASNYFSKINFPVGAFLLSNAPTPFANGCMLNMDGQAETASILVAGHSFSGDMVSVSNLPISSGTGGGWINTDGPVVRSTYKGGVNINHMGFWGDQTDPNTANAIAVYDAIKELSINYVNVDEMPGAMLKAGYALNTPNGVLSEFHIYGFRGLRVGKKGGQSPFEITCQGPTGDCSNQGDIDALRISRSNGPMGAVYIHAMTPSTRTGIRQIRLVGAAIENPTEGACFQIGDTTTATNAEQVLIDQSICNNGAHGTAGIRVQCPPGTGFGQQPTNVEVTAFQSLQSTGAENADFECGRGHKFNASQLTNFTQAYPGSNTAINLSGNTTVDFMNAGNLYTVTSAGTSCTTANPGVPPTGTGSSYTDGTCTYAYVSAAPLAAIVLGGSTPSLVTGTLEVSGGGQEVSWPAYIDPSLLADYLTPAWNIGYPSAVGTINSAITWDLTPKTGTGTGVGSSDGYCDYVPGTTHYCALHFSSYTAPTATTAAAHTDAIEFQQIGAGTGTFYMSAPQANSGAGQIVMQVNPANGQLLLPTYTPTSASIVNNRLLGNFSGASASPAAVAVTTALDSIDPTQGDLLFRNGSQWTNLLLGMAGQVLTVNSGGTAPVWSTPAASGSNPASSGYTYWTGSAWGTSATRTAWTTCTATMVLSTPDGTQTQSGTFNCKYRQEGSLVFVTETFNGTLALGTGSGNLQFSLPVAVASGPADQALSIAPIVSGTTMAWPGSSPTQLAFLAKAGTSYGYLIGTKTSGTPIVAGSSVATCASGTGPCSVGFTVSGTYDAGSGD